MTGASCALQAAATKEKATPATRFRSVPPRRARLASDRSFASACDPIASRAPEGLGRSPGVSFPCGEAPWKRVPQGAGVLPSLWPVALLAPPVPSAQMQNGFRRLQRPEAWPCGRGGGPRRFGCPNGSGFGASWEVPNSDAEAGDEGTTHLGRLRYSLRLPQAPTYETGFSASKCGTVAPRRPWYDERAAGVCGSFHSRCAAGRFKGRAAFARAPRSPARCVHEAHRGRLRGLGGGRRSASMTFGPVDSATALERPLPT